MQYQNLREREEIQDQCQNDLQDILIKLQDEVERCFEGNDKSEKLKVNSKNKPTFSNNSNQMETKQNALVPGDVLNHIGSGALYTCTTTVIRQRNEFKAELNSKVPQIINPRYQQTVERVVKFFMK